jgi:hypothetical protein
LRNETQAHDNVAVKAILPAILVISFIVTQAFADCDSNQSKDCGKIGPSKGQVVGLIIGSVAVSASVTFSIYLTTRKKDERAAYLKENNKAVRTALAITGHEKAMDDLLKMFEVPDAKRDAAVERLRSHRVSMVHSLDEVYRSDADAKIAEQTFGRVLHFN